MESRKIGSNENLAIDKLYLEKMNFKELLGYAVSFMEKSSRLEKELNDKNNLLNDLYSEEKLK